LDYVMNYSLNGTNVNQMIDAGIYDVTVTLNAQNFVGSKTFKFTINKVAYAKSVINPVKIDVSSSSLMVSGLENVLLSIDNNNFFEETVNGLQSKTEYTVYVKVLEDKNHFTTTFNLGEFVTCPSAEFINQQIEILNEKELDFEDIDSIKQLIKEREQLSEKEQELLNDENYIQLKEKYDAYFNQIEQDIEEIRVVSHIVEFGQVKIIKRLSVALSGLCLGLVTLKKGRKKDESNI